MSKKEVYRIEIPIVAEDKYSAEFDRGEKRITKFEGALDKTVKRVNKRLNDLTNGRWSVTLRAVDQASRVASRVASFINRTANRSYRFTLRAIDMATRTIGGIRRAITSIPALITIGLSIVGAGKLKDATVGAAMSFEQYEVSMTHWLGGNVKQAKDLVKWMGQFADTTPFSSVDLFPALVEGVNLSKGDIGGAQRYLKIAADMAALTPNRSVEDAMLAISSAQSGNFEMMKAFQSGITKKELQAMGGWEKYLDMVEDKFKDGARKLSETSEGILMTLKGYRSSIFRSLGDGILEPMKPRLDAINQWLANNQDTWGRWKETVRRHGENASEFVFSRLQGGFEHIKSRYLDNKDFMKLGFKGKIDFVMSDINQWWSDKGKPAVSEWWESSGKPWASETGLSIGQAISAGIVLGIKEGVSTLGDLWKNAIEDPSAKSIGGAVTATVLAGAAGSMLLSPFLRMGGGMIRGGKWASGQIGKIGRGGAVAPPVIATTTKALPKKDTYSEAMKRMASTQSVTKSGGWLASLFGKGGAGAGSKILKRIPVLGTLLGALAIGSATKEERPGVVGSVAGGLVGAKGGAVTGAAIGSVVPGVGTAIGGVAGGLIGGIAGAFGGEWLGKNWDIVKEKAGDAASWVGTKFTEAKDSLSATLFSKSWWSGKWEGVKSWGAEKLSDTREWWDGIKQTASDTLFNGGWWIEQAGYIFGYLESTIFSGEWWSGHWQNIKEITAGTMFDPAWWGEKWEATKTWASDKWSNAVELWEDVKTGIKKTLFSAEWWSGKWEDVKGWASEKWETFTTVWEATKTGLKTTLFNGEWWMGRWEDVKGWTSEKWDSFKTVWEVAKEQISSTLFSKEWWSGKWDTVKGWASGAMSVIRSGVSVVKERFSTGREKGKQAAGATPEYANGGYINSPHLGLVGEAGPEMIIPLSSGRRNRAMELYQRTGRMLGVQAYANGGLVGKAIEPIVSAVSMTYPQPIGPAPATSSTSVSFGPVSISLSSNDGGNADSIIHAVIEKFGSEVIPQLREALANRYA